MVTNKERTLSGKNMLVVPDLQSVAIQIMFHKKIIEMNETFIYTYVLMI